MAEIDYTLLDDPQISMMMFYPRMDFTTTPAEAEDHNVDVERGVTIGCRAHFASKDAPTILFFHGNGEVVSDYDYFAPFYMRNSINLIVADYRGYGSSLGQPSFSAMMGDAKLIYDYFVGYLQDNGYDGPLYVMGRSLGAMSAMEVTAKYQDSEGPFSVKGLILESGAGITVWDRWRPSSGDLERWDRMKALYHSQVEGITVPLLTIHGEVDELIPVERALETRGILGSSEKELLIIPGAGHNDIFLIGLSEYMQAVHDFVTKSRV